MRVLQFLAVVLTALAFVPVGAHLFELPQKIALAERDYFVVQSIYRNWALFGIVIFSAIATNILLALTLWRRSQQFWMSLAAALILAITLVVFFAWTYPANQATDNWTVVTADWEQLRRQWELSHAVNALLTFVALCCAILSALLVRD